MPRKKKTEETEKTVETTDLTSLKSEVEVDDVVSDAPEVTDPLSTTIMKRGIAAILNDIIAQRKTLESNSRNLTRDVTKRAIDKEAVNIYNYFEQRIVAVVNEAGKAAEAE